MESILLVEDSRFLRSTSERALIRAGYRVESTGDGAEALRLAKQNVPDLILLDMLLPTLGGPQVLQALKQDPTTASVPIIVLSSLSQSNEDKLKHDGASAYIEKSKLNPKHYAESLIEAVKMTLAGL